MTLANKVKQFNQDSDIAHQVVHGDSNTVVMTEGGPLRSFAKVMADFAGTIASAIGFNQYGAGAVPRNLLDKGREWVSILDHGGSTGGSDDDAMRNSQAIMSLSAAGFRRIRFPAVGNNNYRFDGSLNPGATAGMEWDVDPGVDITALDVGYLHATLKVVRPTNVIITAFNRSYQLTPARGYAPAFRPSLLPLSEVDHSTTAPVRPDSGRLRYRSVNGRKERFGRATGAASRWAFLRGVRSCRDAG
jgi:hypothetical protein